jgi:phospholipid transport system transporter-binding protein
VKIASTDIGMANAAEIAEAGIEAIRSGDTTIDLSAVLTCDSSAVAAVLAWQREAARAGAKLQLIGLPSSLLSLAAVYGVDSLLAVAS